MIAMLILPGILDFPYSEDKFNEIKKQKEELEIKLAEINRMLALIGEHYKILKSIYDPHITVVEVNTKSMGHRFMGKFRCYLDGKPKTVTINIGKFEDYKRKDNPKLIDDGKVKAKEWQIRKYPHYFQKN